MVVRQPFAVRRELCRYSLENSPRTSKKVDHALDNSPIAPSIHTVAAAAPALRKRGKLPPQTTDFLRRWLFAHT